MSSFLTTVSVFLPLSFLAGELGAVLQVLPIVLIATLAASLIEAFLILPHHLKGSVNSLQGASGSRLRRGFERGFAAFRERVGRVADAVIRARYAVLGLVLLWLIARALPWLALPVWGDALLAAAFPLALAWSLRRPLWNGPNPVNRVFLLLLGGMTVAAAWSHLSAAGAVPAGLLDADSLMLGLVLITLLIVSGRVLPFFTKAAINDAEPKSHQWLEVTTFVAAGAWLTADLISPWPALKAITALAFALSLVARLSGWHDRRAWRIPILAVLYAGALWLMLGLILDAGAELGLMAPNVALHALTAGAIGVFTLGMMVRVTLGHTGRAMVSPPSMTAAFVAINLAALVRVAFPLLWPAHYNSWMLLSGLLWSGAFAAFLVVIGPMLLAARVDGRPI
nr:NnrS family protein [Halochromatium glycolicum]